MEKDIVIFNGEGVRRKFVGDEWFFSIVDVVRILSESIDARQYMKKMRQRDSELQNKWGTICTPVEMIAQDGKMRLINCATKEGLFRIIQSIPSKKAEPFKLWLAKVGSERIEEIDNPELMAERMMKIYLKKGYSREWINQRLKSIEIRKDLTDEWENRGVKEGVEYAILTDEITRAWSGYNVKGYKRLKDLKTEGLRDNMTNLELVLNMLAEATTTEISKKEEPEEFVESLDVARRGGGVAGVARRKIEGELGEGVVSGDNYLSIRKRGVKGRRKKIVKKE